MKKQYKGMTFKNNKNGTFTVTSDYGKYECVCESFGEATLWIYNMANNNDVGNEFVRRICDAFKCNVFGDPDGTYEN